MFRNKRITWEPARHACYVVPVAKDIDNVTCDGVVSLAMQVDYGSTGEVKVKDPNGWRYVRPVLLWDYRDWCNFSQYERELIGRYVRQLDEIQRYL